jgi:galactokinase
MFIKNVGTEYREKTGLNADFYIVAVSDGARKI